MRTSKSPQLQAVFIGWTLTVSLILVLLGALPVSAQITTWSGSTSNNWNTAGNWTSGVPTASTTAVFYSSGTNLDITLGGSTRSALGLLYNSSADSNVAISGSTQLQIGSGGITIDAGSDGSHSIVNTNLGIRLTAAASSTTTFTNNSAQTYTINSSVQSTNASSLAFAGSGNFLFNFAGDAFVNTPLSGITLNSAYTGTVTIAAGSRANAPNGDISVNGGAFRLDGTTHSEVSITINNGGTLLGSGTANNTSNTGIGIQVNSGGVVNPGAIAGTGTLTINRTSTTFGAGSTLRLDLLSNTSYDQLRFTLIGTGTPLAPLTLTTTGSGVALNINLLTGFSANLNDTFSIVNGFSSRTGTFAGLANNATFTEGAYTFRINYNVSDIALTVTNVVPEPTTTAYMLVLLPAAFWAYFPRRRKTSHA